MEPYPSGYFGPDPVMSPPMAAFSSPPPVATEGTPLHNPDATPVLVLAPHARMGRQISTVVALLFLLGFHLTLIATAALNWELPCERPLPVFLLSAGVLGVLAAGLYALLEVQRNRDEDVLLPTEQMQPPNRWLKLLVLLVLIGAIGLCSVGAAMYDAAPTCAHTSPVVHTWTLATLLLYASFGLLVLGVPVLGFVFPMLAIGLVPIIATLVTAAGWLREAGKRGAHSAASVLTRWLRRGADDDVQQPPPPTIVNPASTFGLYVNTAALVWLFGFMIVEARRSWALPCDAPLGTYVLGVGALGVLLAVLDFVIDVFKDPMPPITKLEQAKANEGRRRKLIAYGWVGLVVVVWGFLGCLWVSHAKSCAVTSPTIYRLALLLSFLYVVVGGLAALAAVGIGIDFCLSGKLRFIVVFEQ